MIPANQHFDMRCRRVRRQSTTSSYWAGSALGLMYFVGFSGPGW
ncbi:MAG: hypothetical protein ACRDRX_15185 [Pseudonocardiaceae bacterium]